MLERFWDGAPSLHLSICPHLHLSSVSTSTSKKPQLRTLAITTDTPTHLRYFVH